MTTQNVTQLKNSKFDDSKCDNSNTWTVTKLKNSRCDKTQKLKM